MWKIYGFGQERSTDQFSTKLQISRYQQQRQDMSQCYSSKRRLLFCRLEIEIWNQDDLLWFGSTTELRTCKQINKRYIKLKIEICQAQASKKFCHLMFVNLIFHSLIIFFHVLLLWNDSGIKSITICVEMICKDSTPIVIHSWYHLWFEAIKSKYNKGLI